MATKATGGAKKEFKLVPAGTHLARCYQFLHIGNVPNTFPGAQSAVINKIRLTWELPDEKVSFKEGEEPKPFSISQDYTLSMNEKANLRKMVQSWLGQKMTDEEATDFDVETLVGKPCLLTIVHTTKGDKTYASVNNVTALPGKMECPAAINAPSVINWETMTVDAFNALPEFLQKKMQEAAEYRAFAEANNINVTDHPAF